MKTEVEIPGLRGRVPLSEIYCDKDSRTKYLEGTHKAGLTVLCCCNGTRPKLFVKKSPLDRLYLASKSGQGPLHEDWCYFGSGGILSKYSTAIKRDADGTYVVHVDLELPALPRVCNAGNVSSTYSRKPSPRQGKATLLGFFEFIWEQAGLNRFQGASVKYSEVRQFLYEASDRISIFHKKFCDVLFLPAQPNQELNTLLDWVAEDAPNRDERFFVISPVSASPSAYVNGQMIIRPVNIKGIYYAVDGARYRMLIDAYGDLVRDVKVWDRTYAWGMFVCHIEVDRFGARHAAIDKVIWIITDGDCIPLDSSHEARMCFELKQLRRSFDKPLRYDADNAHYHPDFLLTDIEGNSFYPIEVWGMVGDPYYDQHRIAKTAFYNKELGNMPNGWFSWDASTALDLSQIPSAWRHT